MVSYVKFETAPFPVNFEIIFHIIEVNKKGAVSWLTIKWRDFKVYTKMTRFQGLQENGAVSNLTYDILRRLPITKKTIRQKSEEKSSDLARPSRDLTRVTF